MSEIHKIDDKNFSKRETATTPYNVDTLAAQIDTLNKRIAQNISNKQDEARAIAQPIQDEIVGIQQLLVEAGKIGVVVPDQPVSDVVVLLSNLDALKKEAAAIAAPVVIDPPPVEDPPPEEPPVEEPPIEAEEPIIIL